MLSTPTPSPRVALTYGPLRPEERLLLHAFEQRGISCCPVDDRRLSFVANERSPAWDVVLARGVSQQRTFHLATILEASGVTVINGSALLELCNDKVRTSALLAGCRIPQPNWSVAFEMDSALDAMEEISYPVVLKPTVGSWGRLLARVNSRDTAQTIIEQKAQLGSHHHGSIYIQEYVEKRGRDIRAFVIGGETICAIYRSSEHWITNTARGGTATNCPVTTEIAEICTRCSQALGGGLLAVDLFETDDGLLVNEINATMEFRNSIDTTGVDIPARIVDYTLAVATGRVS